MFTAALFTIAKTWKQPKYTSIDEQIKESGTYTIWILFSHGKGGSLAIGGNMNIP